MAGKLGRLVSAATRYGERKIKHGPVTQGWQEQAWSYYGDGDTPEVGFAANWIGNAMGHAVLFAGHRMPDGSVEPLPDEHPASEAVASIAGGPAGQAQMLTESGVHLVVAGEEWIVVCRGGDDWRVLSTMEVKAQARGLEVEIDGEQMTVPAGPNMDFVGQQDDVPVAIRVWEPHPRRHREADSPVRRSLSLLAELRLLNASVAAIARSQLVGRGVFTVSQGISFPTPPGMQEDDADVIASFLDVAETAIKDPESAAATVPIILEVPEGATPPEWISFASEFDSLAVQLREEAVRRFAAGLDTPAEILLGQSEANHWTAWTLQEEAIRLAVEPRLRIICDALTTRWLRPGLHGLDDIDEIVVWYDTAPLRVRANRPQTAIEAYREEAIGLDALRRELGFDDGDAPTEAERLRNLLVQVLGQAPSLAPQILPLLGIHLDTSQAAIPAAETTDQTPDEDGSDNDALPVDESPRAPAPPDDTGPGTEPEPSLAAAIVNGGRKV